MAKMTKRERLNKSLTEARLLSAQGRWAEAKLKYETIIATIMPPLKSKK
jgi:hypothetical protein